NLLSAFTDAHFNPDVKALRKQGKEQNSEDKTQAAREEMKIRTADKTVEKFAAWFKVSKEQALEDIAELKKGPAEAGKFMAHMLSPLGTKLRDELALKTAALIKDDAKEAKKQGIDVTLTTWANQLASIANTLFKIKEQKKANPDTTDLAKLGLDTP